MTKTIRDLIEKMKDVIHSSLPNIHGDECVEEALMIHRIALEEVLAEFEFGDGIETSLVVKLQSEIKELLGHDEGYKNSITFLEAHINAYRKYQYSFDPMWVSVEDRLPQFDEIIFACLKSGYDSSPKFQFMLRHYEEEGWYWCDHNGEGDDYPVTHWVSLPESPESYDFKKPEVW